MARIHGRAGQFYIGITGSQASAEPVAFLSSWSIDFKTDDVDVTAFGDTNKVYVSGLPDVGGDVAGFYDTATSQLYLAANDGQPRRFYLYPSTPANTGQYWFGTGLFDTSFTSKIDGAVELTGTWKAATAVAKVG